MAEKKLGDSYESIVREVRAGLFKPFYLLMGHESYYIDKLLDLIVNNALKEEEKDFNLINFFAADVDVANIITTAKGFPMMATHLVVVVREAQNLAKIEDLHYYLKQIQPSTILIVCYKNGTVNTRSKLVSLAGKEGCVFVSNKLYDSQIPAFINNYAKSKKISMEPKAVSMLADSVGADLSRVASEMDKLIISLPESNKLISSEQVEQLIGVSKDFNNFELLDALIKKDVIKSNRIVNYFDKNSKKIPIQMILPGLFSFFSNLMLAYYAPDKSPKPLASWLGLPLWQIEKNYSVAMKNYNAMKILDVISEIRVTDAKSKGVGNNVTTGGELLKELIFFILH